LGDICFLRLYLYQVAIIVVLVATFMLLKRTVFERQQDLAEQGSLYLGEWALRQSDQPQRLQREIEALRESNRREPRDVLADGRLLARSGSRPAEKLQPEALARLERFGEMRLAANMTVVGQRDSRGHLLAYAIVSLPVGWLRGDRAVAFAIVLVVCALGSIPIARSISTPLSRLTLAASAFGAGRFETARG